jgi:hypothetical protein
MAGTIVLNGDDLYFFRKILSRDDLWRARLERNVLEIWHHLAASPIRPIQCICRICRTGFEDETGDALRDIKKINSKKYRGIDKILLRQNFSML